MDWNAVSAIGTALAGLGGVPALLAVLVKLLSVSAKHKGRAAREETAEKQPSATSPSDRKIRLKGHLSGRRDVWNIEADLVQSAEVNGMFRWRLADCPPAMVAMRRRWAERRQPALEWVKRTYETGRLELTGDKVDTEPHGPGKYIIGIHTDGTRYPGTWRALNTNTTGDVQGEVSIQS